MSSSFLTLVSPIKGIVVPLAEVPDPVFAEGALGQGIALDPLGDCLHAPLAGEVIQCARTHHAFTLRSDAGVEVLIHLGLDTVTLEGRGIEPCVSVGQRVEVGDLLCHFDVDKLACEATSLITPLIVIDAPGWRWAETGLKSGDVVQRGDSLVVLEAIASAEHQAVSAQGPKGERSVVLALETGLHARPAARLRAIAREHDVSLNLTHAEHSANVDSISGLMNLGLVCGAIAILVAEGARAEEALDAAERLLTTPEGAQPPKPVQVVIPDALGEGLIAGLTASPGLASGPLARLEVGLPSVPEEGVGRDLEAPRLEAALRVVGSRLEKARHQAECAGQAAEAEVFEAHQAWLEDPGLLQAAVARLEQGYGPGKAWREALDDEAERLGASGNPILVGRIDDLRDLQRQVMAEFSDAPGDAMASLPSGAIVVATELTPSEFVELCAYEPAGLALAVGGTTSHVAILARARGIPCLVAMGEGLHDLSDATVVLDADRGRLEITPDQVRLDEVRACLEQRRAQAQRERCEAHLEAATRDGRMIEIAANIGSSNEARLANDSGADGVGLMRSEFLFLGRDSAPSEDEQRREYQATVDAMQGKPVIIRTLDIGADKQLPYLTLPKAPNPALGVRGVRLWQSEPSLLDTQLRALLGVKPLRHLRIMVPMISDGSELEWVRERLEAMAAEMCLTELPLLGAMVEVPSAALCAGAMAHVADFLSIGTNDLTQYGLAMDREDPLLTGQADVLHPGVLRLIQASVLGAAGRCPVGVCGAAAGDPLVAPLLIAMGVNELSVEPSRIAAIKALVRRLDMAIIAREIDSLLTLPDAQAVRRYLVPLVESALVPELTRERSVS